MNKIKLVFATNNQNKLTEVKAMLTNFDIVSLNDINCFDDIPETAKTLEGNAKIKADFITNKFGLNCFADDTGLEVESLNMEPGVYSARYGGPARDSEANMQKLLTELEGKSNRYAQFRTAVALNLDGKQHIFEGICKGEILENKTGAKGFGYDPIFKPENFNQSFAEMTMEQKSSISHRGRAIAQLVNFLNNYTCP